MEESKQKKSRVSKLDKEQIIEKMNEINHGIYTHINKPAIMLVKEGRDMVPYFVELKSVGTAVMGQYSCFNQEGEFRCFQTKQVNVVSILTGEQVLMYFDDI